MGDFWENWQCSLYFKKKYFSIAMTGGRGKKIWKCLNFKMSQSGLRGGRVNLIETMSQNLQFFFFEGFPYLICSDCLKLSSVKHCIAMSRHTITYYIHFRFPIIQNYFKNYLTMFTYVIHYKCCSSWNNFYSVIHV